MSSKELNQFKKFVCDFTREHPVITGLLFLIGGCQVIDSCASTCNAINYRISGHSTEYKHSTEYNIPTPTQNQSSFQKNCIGSVERVYNECIWYSFSMDGAKDCETIYINGLKSCANQHSK